MSNVAHSASKRPPKASRKSPAAKKAVESTEPVVKLVPAEGAERFFTSAADAHEYGRACLEDARKNLDHMAALALIDDDDLDTEKFRDFASGLTTNLGGAISAHESLAYFASKADDPSLSQSGERAAKTAELSPALKPGFGARVREQVAWVMLAQKRRAEGGDERACDLEIVGALEHLSALSIDLDEEESNIRTASRSLSGDDDLRLARAVTANTNSQGESDLRMLVDRAVDEIEGLEESAREGLDKAIAVHSYVAGSCGGDCTGHYVGDRRELAQRFNESIAYAVAHMKCVIDALDPLRKHASAEAEDTVDAAAEE